MFTYITDSTEDKDGIYNLFYIIAFVEPDGHYKKFYGDTNDEDEAKAIVSYLNGGLDPELTSLMKKALEKYLYSKWEGGPF